MRQLVRYAITAIAVVLLSSLTVATVMNQSWAKPNTRDQSSVPVALAAQATPTPDQAQAQDGVPELQRALLNAIEQVRDAVPVIVAEQPRFGFGPQQEGIGSGVVFDEEGLILTNNHVIAGAENIRVILPSGREFDAEVIGRAPESDLAVLDIDGNNLPVAPLGSSGDLEVGQYSVAIGNALGLPGGPSVTSGVISALNRVIGGQGQPLMENLIQTDAAINPGNSGGPLINLEGEVIGINTAAIRGAEGLGFAIPIDEAERIVDQILSEEPQAFLGIAGAPVNPQLATQFNLDVQEGVFVANVQEGGPAAEAGIRQGDVITAIEGEEIATVEDLRQALQDFQPGDEVTVTVVRNGEEQQIDVTLGESVIVRE